MKQIKNKSRNLKIDFPEIHELMESGSFLQASFAIEKSLKQKNNESLLYHLALCHFQMDNPQKSQELLQDLICLNSQNLKAIRLLVDVFIADSQYKSAISVINEGLKICKLDPVLSEKLFICYYYLNQHSKAYKSYFEIPGDMLSPESMNFMIKVSHCLKKHATVLSIFNELDPSQSLSDLSHYQATTYKVIALFSLDKTDEVHSELHLLKQYFEPSEEKIKCFKLIYQITRLQEFEEFALKGIILLAPNSIKAKIDLLNFYRNESPNRCLDELELLLDAEQNLNPQFKKIKALCYRDLNKLSLCSDILEELFLKDPTDDEICFELGVTRFNNAQYDKSLHCFERLINTPFPTSKLHYYLSCIYYHKKQYDSMRKHLFMALDEQPICKESWEMLLEVYSQNLLDDAFLSYIEMAELHLENSIEGLKKLAKIYKLSNPQKTLEFHETITQLEPHNFDSQLYVALKCLEHKQYTRSYRAFSQIKDQLNERQLSLFIQSCEKSLNYSQAFEIYLKLSQDQTKADILFPKIIQLIKIKLAFSQITSLYNYEDLKPYANVLIKVPLFYYKTGVYYFATGELDLAKKYLLKLSQSNTKKYRSSFFLGLIYWSKKKNSEAIIWLEQALRDKDQKVLQIHSLLGEIYFDNQQNQKAKHSFISLFQAGIQQVQCLEYLYQIFKAENALNRFIHLITEANHHLLEKSSVRFLLASAYFDLNQYKKAALHYSSIEKHSPFNCRAQFQQALSLMKLSQFESSLKIFKQLQNQAKQFDSFYYYYALNLFELRKYVSAKNMFCLSVETSEMLEESYKFLSKIGIKVSDTSLAVSNFIELRKSTFDFDLCFDLTKFLFQHNDYQKLETIIDYSFQQLLEMNHTKKDQLFQSQMIALYERGKNEKLSSYLQLIHEQNSKFLIQFVASIESTNDFKLLLVKLGLNIAKDQVDFQYEIANLYYDLKQFDQALTYFNSWEECSSSNNEQYQFICHFKKAQILYQNQDLHSSLEELDKAHKLQSSHIETINKMSFLYGKVQDFKNQASMDQKLFYLRVEDPSVSQRLLKYYTQKSDLQNMLTHIKVLIKQQIEVPKNMLLLAEVSNKLGMYSQEIWAYENILKGNLRPDHNLYLKMGNACLAMKSDLKAADYFQKYMDKNPKNTGLQFQLAKIYKSHDLYKKADYVLQNILKLEPSNPSVLFELAHNQFKEQNFMMSVNYLNKCIKVKPYHEDAQFLLSQIHFQTGNSKIAMTHLEKTLQLSNKHIEARELMAKIYKSENLYQDSLSIYESLVRDQYKPEYQLEIGVLNLKLNKRDTALCIFKDLIARSKRNSKFYKLAHNLLRKENVA
ncbi:MAG: tetratricopeptide repeat protein [Candidatus Cloacimonetes bacterium]|nr:tetratricopeptide repeat protein [Candidatus Cloacimonadota bacterium]